jgi:ABC-type transport system involved in multi-copper enzyme maturation permease subunit
MDQVRSELIKLRTARSSVVMLLALAAIMALGVVAVVSDSGAAVLVRPLEAQPALHVALTIAPVFALLLGIRSFTDEFRFGSIVPTLLATPERRRVFAGKVAAAAVGGVVLGLAALGMSVAVAVAALLVKGAAVTVSAGPAAILAGRLLLSCVLWSALGVGFGLAVRHQVAAIAGALVWMLAGEALFSGLVPSVARFFPGAAGFGLVGINAASTLAPLAGGAVLAAYAIAAASIGGWLMNRRDIA